MVCLGFFFFQVGVMSKHSNELKHLLTIFKGSTLACNACRVVGLAVALLPSIGVVLGQGVVELWFHNSSFLALGCQSTGTTRVGFVFFSLGPDFHFPCQGVHQCDLGDKCFNSVLLCTEGATPSCLWVEALHIALLAGLYSRVFSFKSCFFFFFFFLSGSAGYAHTWKYYFQGNFFFFPKSFNCLVHF